MDKKEIVNWGERMEAGITDELTLELASELATRRPAVAKPSTRFVRELRQELLTPSKRHVRKSLIWLAPAIVVAALGALVVISILPVEPASAAEVFERANQHYAGLAQEDGILHSEFTLTYSEIDIIDGSVIREHRWGGELSQDLASPEFRHTLADYQGTIHYFAQRYGDGFWRSAYPVLASKGDLVYFMTEEQYYTSDGSAWRGIAPIFGTLIDWLSLDSWWISNGAECQNPFCAIGLEDNDVWSCEDDRCIFPMSSAIDDIPFSGVQVTLVGQEHLLDGRTVETMEIRVGIEEHLVRQLKFDSSTYELIELVAYQMGSEMARMAFSSREVLDREQASLFATLPDQLREVVWESVEAPPEPRLAYAPFPGAPTGSPPTAWVLPVFALPRQGSTLLGKSEIELFLRANPPFQEDVELTAELCSAKFQAPPAPYDISSCGGLATATIGISKGSATARVPIQVQPDSTWPDAVWVMLRWVYPDGQEAWTLDPEYFWLVEP